MSFFATYHSTRQYLYHFRSFWKRALIINIPLIVILCITIHFNWDEESILYNIKISSYASLHCFMLFEILLIIFYPPWNRKKLYAKMDKEIVYANNAGYERSINKSINKLNKYLNEKE